jgi:hypothetical protein
MIVTSTVGKIDASIGRFETPILAFLEKEEQDNAKTSLKKTLYNVKSSKHYSESINSMTGIGDMVADSPEIPYDSFEEGYSKQFIHHTFRKGIEIKRETLDDSDLINIQMATGMISDAYNRTVEKFVHAPFNNCTSTSFNLAGGTFDLKGADGLALCSAAHTSKTGKASNQSNYFDNAPLNAASLKQAEEAFNNFQTDIGEKANVFPDTLIVPFELRNEAFELLGSEGKLATANNDINVYNSKYNLIVSRWLNPGTWFTVDSKYMNKCLYWLDRIPYEVASQKDFNTMNWQIAAYCRFSLGFSDWRWLIGNKISA